MNYEKDSKERIPYEHYLEVYQNADPAEISSRCNVPYDAEKHEFTVSLMGVSYRISWPEYRVQHLGDDGTDGPVIGWYPLEEKPNAKILVLRYLTEGGAAPSTGKFLTYREIRGEKFILNSSRKMPVPSCVWLWRKAGCIP